MGYKVIGLARGASGELGPKIFRKKSTAVKAMKWAKKTKYMGIKSMKIVKW